MKRTKQTEGGVYTCTWRRSKESWELIAVKPIKASVKALTLEDATDRLVSKLMSLTGDGEPHLEFAPALPVQSAQATYEAEYFELTYNHSVTWECHEPRALYSGGICHQCGIGVGVRSMVSRKITSVPRFDVSGFYRDRSKGMMVSEKCLNYLHPYLSGRATLVPVEVDSRIQKRLRKRYFELSFSPEFHVTVPRNYDSASGWRCKACGAYYVAWTSDTVREVASGVERRHLTSPVLLFRSGSGHSIAINVEVRKNIIGDKTVSGFTSDRIAVIESGLAMSGQEIAALRLRQLRN